MTEQTISTADAYDALTGHHRGQHRCDDGNYYGPKVWAECPMNVNASVLSLAMVDERNRVHEAAHNDDAVRAVAEGMTGLVMAELSDEDRQGWMMTARMAIEALAAHLDPLLEPDENERQPELDPIFDAALDRP